MIKKTIVTIFFVILMVALLPIVSALSAIAGVCLYLLFSGVLIMNYWGGDDFVENVKDVANKFNEGYDDDKQTQNGNEEVIEITLPNNELEN